MSRYLTFFVFSVLAFGMICTCKEANATPSDSMNPETQEQANSTEDSLVIAHSDEYKRLVELLIWYKKSNGLYGISSVEKYDRSNPDSAFVYIDDIEVASYLKRCRNSGFFTKNYVQNDSLYIEEAKKAYADPEMEIPDYFDHDFILQTQETDETLKAIPNIKILPDKCDLAKGKIVVVIAFQQLEYTLVKENGVYKLDKIG